MKTVLSAQSIYLQNSLKIYLKKNIWYNYQYTQPCAGQKLYVISLHSSLVFSIVERLESV